MSTNGQDPNVIDVTEILSDWNEKLDAWQQRRRERRPGGGGGGGGRGGGGSGPDPAAIGSFALVLFGLFLVGALLLSSWFTVPQNSVGLVQRFGQHVRTVDPGLHLKWPWGVERVIKVAVEEVHRQEFGYTTVMPGQRTEYTVTAEDRIVSMMLSGDLNIANVEWSIQYKIKDPVSYTFRVRNVEETVRDLSEAVMRNVVGDRSVTEVLTVGRTEIAAAMESDLQKLLDSYETGIELVTVQLQDVRPPGPVEASFNEVNEAKQEQERMINQAWEQYNKSIPAAEGEAARVVAEAEGYAIDRTNRAEGDASRFNALYEEYRRARDVTRRRIYIETMNDVLPKVDRLLVIDKDGDITPFLGMEGLGGSKGGAK